MYRFAFNVVLETNCRRRVIFAGVVDDDIFFNARREIDRSDEIREHERFVTTQRSDEMHRVLRLAYKVYIRVLEKMGELWHAQIKRKPPHDDRRRREYNRVPRIEAVRLRNDDDRVGIVIGM